MANIKNKQVNKAVIQVLADTEDMVSEAEQVKPIGKSVPLSTQMRIEKTEEEAMYAKRGDGVLREYYQDIEKITKAAKEEFELNFHDYLSLARRRQVLEDLRRTKELEQIRGKAKVIIEEKTAAVATMQANTPPHLKGFPSTEEMEKTINDRVESAKIAAKERQKLEQDLRNRDREIERLSRALEASTETKSPKQKAFERRMQRKAKRSHGMNVISQTFRFPPLQVFAEKLYEADRAISDFLLDIGNAEYVVTKENIISTAARRLMQVRAIDEPEFVIDPDGNLVSKWALILDKMTNPKKYNSNG